ncbi:glycosyltransferase family 17-domain-containing protein [Neocallimastix sp. 'constans']
MKNQIKTYQLIENPLIQKKVYKNNYKKIKIILSFIISINIIGITLAFLYLTREQSYDLILIKGKTRKDKYGIDLNANILNGIYKDWDLYTPPCPNLQPVHYPESISNPKCEESSLQIPNYNNDDGRGLPHSLHLHSISEQLKNWENWVKMNNTTPSYGGKTSGELVDNIYYPFDYGYTGSDTSDINDEEYYKNVINSRMDEVPDPRRRRLFSFILFNTEFDLLDVYLSEYYEIFDYFVIYESNTTFSGMAKPLFFTRTLLETNRYDKYKDKLIPLPIVNTFDNNEGFPKENISRRLLIENGLRSVQARHGDIFIHGDLDEMPKSHILFRLKKCGGWEHLQAGIGGGPKSFKEENVKSYLVNNENNNKDYNDSNNEPIDVELTSDGRYKVDYDKEISVSFLSYHYEYSFNIVKDSSMGTLCHPNLAIFDARRSLGQFPERTNRKTEDIVKREHVDILSDPNFDPYKGYTYSENKNEKKNGKGFITENIRFNYVKDSDYERLRKDLFWNGGWHMSSFLPTIDIIYNKVSSYSHFTCFRYYIFESIKKKVIAYRIKKHAYIFGDFERYEDNYPMVPRSYNDGYPYNFNNKFWDELIKNNATSQDYKDQLNLLKYEVPTHVWKNPICYNYMLDRDFGIKKKLWWQIIPKVEWKTINFNHLNSEVIDKLIPANITEEFKNQMLNQN